MIDDIVVPQDNASPVVQAWALHALALIADSGGPMFRGFVEPTLSCVLRLLLTTPSCQVSIIREIAMTKMMISAILCQVDVLTCLGRLLAAVITTLGPEMSTNSSTTSTARSSVLVATDIMQVVVV